MASVQAPGSCALLFWRQLPNRRVTEFLYDAVTGFSGIWGVALDFSLQGGGCRWVITSGEYRLLRGKLSGPHYAPLEACRGAALARIDISGVIDSRQLLTDLQSTISDPGIRHKNGAAALSYLLGTTREDHVTCSSLIGRAILRQPSQSLARALREALEQRLTYGEITPADLARAAAILNLGDAEVPPRRIQTVPLLKSRTRPGARLNLIPGDDL